MHWKKVLIIYNLPKSWDPDHSCNEGISLLEKIKKLNLSTTPDIINQYRAGPGPLKLDKLTFDYGLTFWKGICVQKSNKVS